MSLVLNLNLVERNEKLGALSCFTLVGRSLGLLVCSLKPGIISTKKILLPSAGGTCSLFSVRKRGNQQWAATRSLPHSLSLSTSDVDLHLLATFGTLLLVVYIFTYVYICIHDTYIRIIYILHIYIHTKHEV